MEEKKWFGTWPAKCDLCETSLADTGFFVDGRINGRMTWALMCPHCFYNLGAGLGLGQGQKYDSKTLIKLEG